MTQKNNHDFEEKHPYVCVGTLVLMRMRDILTKKLFFIVCMYMYVYISKFKHIIITMFNDRLYIIFNDIIIMC